MTNIISNTVAQEISQIINGFSTAIDSNQVDGLSAEAITGSIRKLVVKDGVTLDPDLPVFDQIASDDDAVNIAIQDKANSFAKAQAELLKLQAIAILKEKVGAITSNQLSEIKRLIKEVNEAYLGIYKDVGRKLRQIDKPMAYDEWRKFTAEMRDTANEAFKGIYGDDNSNADSIVKKLFAGLRHIATKDKYFLTQWDAMEYESNAPNATQEFAPKYTQYAVDRKKGCSALRKKAKIELDKCLARIKDIDAAQLPDDAEFAALGKAIHECKTLHEDGNAPKLESSDRHYTAKSIEAAESALAVAKKQVQQIKDNAAKAKDVQETPESEAKDVQETPESEAEDEPKAEAKSEAKDVQETPKSEAEDESKAEAEDVKDEPKSEAKDVKDIKAEPESEAEDEPKDEAAVEAEDEPEGSHEPLLLDDDKRLITAIQVNYDNVAKVIESHLATSLGCEPRQVLDIQELVNNQKTNVIRQVTRMMDKHHQTNTN